jgi:hypothetical protein
MESTRFILNFLRNFKLSSSLSLVIALLTSVASCASTPTKTASGTSLQPSRSPGGPLLADLLELSEPPSMGAAERSQLGIKVIDAKVARSYPHLQSFGGNIALLNRTLQIVVPGRSLDGIRGLWHPLVTAAFILEGSQWQQVNLLSDIQTHIASNSPARFVGIDLNADKRQLSAAMVFESASNSRHRFGVTVSLDTEQNLVMLSEFGRRSGPSDNSPASFASLVRLTNAPWTSFTPLIEDKPNRHSIEHMVMDSRMSAAVFGGKPSRQYSGAIVLSSDTPTVIAVGRNESSIGDLLSHGFNNCGRRDDAVLDFKAAAHRNSRLADCAMKHIAANSSLVSVEFPEDLSDATTVQTRPILVRNEVTKKNSKRFLARPGEIFNTRIQVGSNIELADAISDSESISVDVSDASSESIKAFFPPRSWGEVEIKLLSRNQSEADVPGIIRLTGARKGLRAPIEIELADLPRISSNSFLVQRWPLSLELPEGSYRISIHSESIGQNCSQNLIVEEKLAAEISCVFGVSAQPDPSNLNAELQMVDALSGEEDTSQDWRNVTGAEILHIPLERDNSSPELDANLGFDGRMLQSFAVTAPLTNIAVRAFPVSRDLVERWQRYREKNGDLDVLPTFTKFARQFAPEAVIEMGCPGLEQSIAHYIKVFDAVEPDMVKYYGCPFVKNNPRLASKLLSRLIDRVTIPPTLGFESSSAGPVNQGIPAISFPKHALDQSPGQGLSRKFSELLKNGSYSFAQGGSANRAADTDQPSHQPVFISKIGGQLRLDDQLKLDLKSKPKRLRVIVYSELGALDSVDMNADPKKLQQSFDIRLAMRTMPKYIRYEIYADVSEGKAAAEFSSLIAATNFLPVRQRSQ